MKRSFFSNGDRGISWTKTFKLEMLDPNFPGRIPEDVPSFRGRPRLPLKNLCTASKSAKKRPVFQDLQVLFGLAVITHVEVLDLSN